MDKRRFEVYLEPAEEGGFIAVVPALPGCATQGETKSEALQMAEDAIAAYLTSLRKHGEALPNAAGEIQSIEVDVSKV